MASLIDDGQVWTDMMLHRNLLSRTYDDQTFNEVLKAVSGKYLPAISKLYEWLNIRMDK
ncbi:MAG: nucleotidyltransferase substrate binding protein [Clostridiales bacterium]